ncbi:uncharacterized protein LOC116118421 [Pistacia vera]|uniref:uncharacterized protein LOC116118421 n=1 Tax=Pistacia vera TaxID=55513 RepID=UPI001262E433|nr:uncharacterized protein LOC116118421 [Pistacia vera]
MACIVSISFSAPLRPPSLNKIYRGKSAPARLSRNAIVTTAANLVAACSLDRGLFPVSQSSHCHLTASLKHFDEIVSCLDISSCTHMKITGYWVGPDVDDGWGFVEAFVKRIT